MQYVYKLDGHFSHLIHSWLKFVRHGSIAKEGLGSIRGLIFDSLVVMTV